MDDIELEKVAISGPTLASLIQRLSSSPGDVDGLLFGHVTQIFPSALSDDSDSYQLSSSDSSSQLVATVTSFICSGTTFSFHDSLGQVQPGRLDSLRGNAPNSLLGWFSARRKTHARPSMREFSVTSSLSSQISLPIQFSQNPNSKLSTCVFFLFTTPSNDQLIHTHEYRAYQYLVSKKSFDPKSIDVVNIGPAFRGHYGAFCPNSPFPLLACDLGSSAMNEERDVVSMDRMRQVMKDQKELDACAEGFRVENLSRLIGPQAANYTGGLEEMYVKMLTKIENLARLVENSSAEVFEKENQNRKLRYKVARVE